MSPLPVPTQEVIDKFSDLVWNGRIDAVLDVYAIYGMNIINAPDKVGQYPVSMAACRSDDEMLKLIIEMGGDVHIDNDVSLIVACINGCNENVEKLVNSGVNKDARYEQNSEFKNLNAYHVACYHGHFDRAFKLYQCGIDILAQDEKGRTGSEVLRAMIDDARKRGVPLELDRYEDVLPLMAQLEQGEMVRRVGAFFHNNAKVVGLPQITTQQRRDLKL